VNIEIPEQCELCGAPRRPSWDEHPSSQVWIYRYECNNAYRLARNPWAAALEGRWEGSCRKAYKIAMSLMGKETSNEQQATKG